MAVPVAGDNPNNKPKNCFISQTQLVGFVFFPLPLTSKLNEITVRWSRRSSNYNRPKVYMVDWPSDSTIVNFASTSSVCGQSVMWTVMFNIPDNNRGQKTATLNGLVWLFPLHVITPCFSNESCSFQVLRWNRIYFSEGFPWRIWSHIRWRAQHLDVDLSVQTWTVSSTPTFPTGRQRTDRRWYHSILAVSVCCF